jgi:hypothetical protein
VKYLALALRIGLGGLFVLAGVLKLGDPTQFAIEVGNYRLLPSLAPYIAVLLPAIEIGVGAGVILLPRDWRRASALAIAGLMVVFTVAVGLALGRGINIDCGCFGGQSGPVSGLTVARDLALLGAAIAVLVLDREPATSR